MGHRAKSSPTTEDITAKRDNQVQPIPPNTWLLHASNVSDPVQFQQSVFPLCKAAISQPAVKVRKPAYRKLVPCYWWYSAR